MIPVTKPFLPPSEEYEHLLHAIWQRNILTNNGPLVMELEQKLKEYLGVPYLLYVSNGTIALQLAIKALGLKGEIVTTPFSYVATTSSIVWEGCTPVYADIDAETLNIDPIKIEQVVTPRTTAILATHVFGNACDIDAIEEIASRHGLKVIYDAAHCFGTRYKGRSIFSYGDISTTSFHATKLFHTVEGGAVFSWDEALIKKMDFMRNFGHNGPENFAEVGINGKNSEFHAAMGLVNLRHITDILESRKQQWLTYDSLLYPVKAKYLTISHKCSFNYAYYPLILSDEKTTLRVIQQLNTNQIFPRRYFYPPLNTVNLYAAKDLPVTESISKRIVCLPLFHGLSAAEIENISDIILKAC